MKSRREIFKKIFKQDKAEEVIPLPPYYKELSDFKRCIECEGVCAKVCEEEIIKIVDKKPILDFSKSGCTFCDECAKSCPYKVLRVENRNLINVLMQIDILKCLAWNQTMCRFCLDVCDERAIKFLGLFRPEIISDICTGCGFCVGVCPTNAIKVKNRIDSDV